jgi:hypothetical protein
VLWRVFVIIDNSINITSMSLIYKLFMVAMVIYTTVKF